MNVYRFERVLVPYDGLGKTGPSVEYAARLAMLLHGKLHVLHVVPKEALESVKDELGTTSDDAAKEYCERRYARLFDGLPAVRQTGLECTASLSFARTVVDGVAFFCFENDVDMVVTRKATSVGSTGKSLPNQLIATESIECLIYKHPFKDDTRDMTLLIPVDNRRSNLACVCRGIALAGTFRCGVILYYSTQHVSPLTRRTCPGDVLENLGLAEELARERGIRYETVLETRPFVDGVLENAVSRNVDLIVMRNFAQEKSLAGSLGTCGAPTGGREGLFMGDATRTVDEGSEHNFLYSRGERGCEGCVACLREYETER